MSEAETVRAVNLKVRDAVLLVFLYVAAGPPIAVGSVVIVAFVAEALLRHHLGGFAGLAMVTLLSWVGGWIPALVTGGVAAGYRFRDTRIPYVAVAAVGAVASAVYSYATEGYALSGPGVGVLLFMAALGVVGALGCRYFGRSIHGPARIAA